MKIVIESLGWILVHSLWQIAAVGGALALALLLTPKRMTEVRYGLALFALIVCMVAPVATYLVARPAESPVGASQATAIPGHSAPYQLAELASVGSSSRPTASLRSVGDAIQPAFPWLVGLWLLGTTFMSIRLAGGILLVQRLRKNSSILDDARLSMVASGLIDRLGLRSKVEVRLCANLETPVVVGFLRAAILLPCGLLTRLSPVDVEALIAHEIAHIKRRDHIVNSLQMVMETLFFFHPVVWWISSVLRTEREHCSDRLAATALNDRVGYAKALLALEESRHPHRRAALAANGGNLAARVRWLLNEPSSNRGGRAPAIFLATLLALALSLGCFAQRGTLPSGGAAIQGSRSAEEQDVTGTVVQRDGKPAANVEVAALYGADLVRVDTRRTTTDSAGRFRFSKVSKKAFVSLWAYSPGVGMGCSSSIDSEARRIVLDPISRAKVRVADANDKPLANVKVRLAGYRGASTRPNAFEFVDELHGSISGTTDTSGVAILDAVPQGCVLQIEIDDDRYATTSADQRPTIVTQPTVNVSLIALPAARLEGRVLNDGAPVADATVVVSGGAQSVPQVVKTGADGTFRFGRLGAGNLDIETRIAPERIGDRVSPRVTVKVAAGQSCVQDVSLVHGAVLSGHLLNPDGSVLPNGTTFVPCLGGMGAFVRGDESGHFEIRVAPGQYIINGKKTSLGEGDNRSVDLQAQQSTRQRNLKQLTGEVVDENGRGVPFAIVATEIKYRSYEPNHNLPTGVMQRIMADSVGRFQLSYEKGTISGISMIASSRDHISAAPTNVGESTSATVRTRPFKPTGLEGRVVDADGRPVKGARVILQHDSDYLTFMLISDGMPTPPDYVPGPVSVTDSDGRYRFEDLRPSMAVYIYARSNGYSKFGRRARLIEGANILPTIVMPRTDSFVEAQVVDTTGKPVAGAKVAAVMASGWVKTGADGRFHIDHVAKGPVQVHVSEGWAETDAFLSAGTRGSRVVIKLLPHTKTNPAYPAEAP